MEFPSSTGGDSLWFGRHSADGDILVRDPEQSASDSSNVTLFSLTQLRPRTFSPNIVRTQIKEISDPEQRALAEQQYRHWPTLKAERDEERGRASTEAQTRQKEQILEAHRHFLEVQGLPYTGVQDSSEKKAGARPRRHRASCQHCGIPLDDFVQARCVTCGSVLCSCGACACRKTDAGE
jgi:hypothetical protein